VATKADTVLEVAKNVDAFSNYPAEVIPALEPTLMIPLQSDPPILIGGGGSTLIWIRKDQNARRLPLEQVPDTTEKPAHPELYDVYVLDNFDCSQVRVHDGGEAHSHPTKRKKHHVWFE